MTDESTEKYVIHKAPETEYALLGSMIRDDSVQRLVWKTVSHEEFAKLFYSYAGIANVVANLKERNVNSSIQNLSDECLVQGIETMEDLPIENFLNAMSLASTVSSAEEVDTAIQYLHNSMMRREIRRGGMELAKESSSASNEALSENLQKVSSYNPVLTAIADMGEVRKLAIESKKYGTTYCVPSGIPDLDDLINGGYEASRLYALGARQKVGKTTFLIRNALQAAIGEGIPVLFCTLEVPKEEMLLKMLSALTLIPYNTLKNLTPGEETSGLSPDEATEWSLNSEKLFNAPLVVVESENLRQGATSVASAISQVKAKYETDKLLVLVDYFQILVPYDGMRRMDLEKTLMRLKQVAIDMDVPIVLAAQLLNRGIEVMGDVADPYEPKPDQFRETGGMEQTADVGILLHRPFLHMPDAPPNQLKIFVGFNRAGRTGNTEAIWSGEHSLVLSMQEAEAAMESAEEFADPSSKKKPKKAKDKSSKGKSKKSKSKKKSDDDWTD